MCQDFQYEITINEESNVLASTLVQQFATSWMETIGY